MKTRLVAGLVLICGISACSSTPETVSVSRNAVGNPVYLGGSVSVDSADRVTEVSRYRVVDSFHGEASWYGGRYNGRPTASGEIFDSALMTAAHRTLGFGTMVRVTRRDTGASVIVKINDRGPFIDGRVIDLSEEAARRLDFIHDGLADVRVEVLAER